MPQIITDLGEQVIAAGDNVSFEFEFFYEDGSPIDLTGGEFVTCQGYLVLSEIGVESENIASFEMELKDNSINTMTCTLSSEDTISLPTRSMTMKPVIQVEDDYYKKARGILTVLADTNEVTV